MRVSPPGHAGFVPTIDRRAWLMGILGGFASARVFATADPEAEAESPESREAEALARALGLKPFRSLQSKHFMAVGNAPDDYLRITLIDCEAVARDYMEHFSAKGFAVDFPRRQMTTVVLEDERAYARFLPGHKHPTAQGERGIYATGVYQRKPNWLVVQDFRNVPRSRSQIPAWAENLQTLAHEATHQLTFNTGLLNREGDVPRCIGEGFAAYGEVRRPNARSLPGQINHRRLSDLARYQRGLGWIPVSRLITDESWWTFFDAPKNFLSYAQSWLLVHYLMTDPDHTPGFRKYLEAIHGRSTPDLRLDDARAHLGDLDKLDVVLKRYSVSLLKQG